MEHIELSTLLPSTAEQVYTDWLSSAGHAKMTGGAAEAIPVVGSKYSAWDGYITGVQLVLTANEYIKQSWRSTEFDAQDPDSLVEIRLKNVSQGCEITIEHSRIPEGQGARYASGWKEHYFTPMQAHYLP